MNRRILGIYIGAGEVRVALARSGLRGLEVVESGGAEVNTTQAAALRTILQGLDLRGARPVVGLAHRLCYMVEVAHPGLTEAEAREATALSLGEYVHCDPADCLYDCITYRRDGTATALLVYCERRQVEPVEELLERLGLGRPVIAPAAVGLDRLIRTGRVQGARTPAVSAAVQEETLLITLHGRKGWEGSHSVPLVGGRAARPRLDALLSRLPEEYAGCVRDGLLAMDQRASEALAGLPHTLATAGGNPVDWAVAAALAGAPNYPPVSLGPGLRRPPLTQRIDTGLVAALALGVVLGGATLYQGVEVYHRYQAVRRLEQRVEKLKGRAAPLASIQKESREMEERLSVLEGFRAKADLPLAVMRLLAQRLPADAWIRNLDYRGERVRINLEGSTAVQVMEVLKGAGIIASVRLASPVTKYRGQERYTIELTIKGGKG